MARNKKTKKPPKVYKWTDGCRLGADPQTCGEELNSLAAAKGDQPLLPGDVWKYARDHEDSELHSLYEWDVQKAAELHWEERSRHIIRSCRVIEDTATGPTEVFAFIHSDTGKDRGYYDAERVITSAELRQRAVQEAVSLLRGVRKRFEHFKEMATLWSQLDQLLENFAAVGVVETQEV